MKALMTVRTFFLWFFCMAVGLWALRFLLAGVETSMEFVAYHAIERRLAFFAHVGLAPVALMLVPLQFWTRLRIDRPALHRWLGRVYAVAILLAGVGGMLMAIGTQAGPVASLGFGLLAVAWVGSTALAVWHIRNKRVALHKAWMIRSAALTLAAVTLRLEMPILAMTIGLETGYPLVAWLCWVPNLMIAEWMVRRRPVMGAAQPA
ncbi:Predicted membrane protein [Shimia haliotis]|uniref:Predicted membrane protein n=2 Tax=Shimia haliotis TaxID=1280847 RepID=A0A1I4A511_9RHOB|nr:Predicted membrane protein [Shimia haliotis]